MSCLSLRFPVSPRRAWKRFTSKLQITKLWKTQRSKSIKKPKNVINSKLVMKTANKHSLFRNNKRCRNKRPSSSSSKQFYYVNKGSATPVYVDRLFFKEPAVSVSELVWNFQSPATTTSAKAEGGGVRELERACAADDVWESLALASPLTEGINERAEEFILRFRTEMQLEETMAHKL